MISRETFKNGLLSYIDTEVIPHLPTLGKWGLGAMVTLSVPKFDEIYDQLACNEMVKTLGLVDEYGNVDEQALIDALQRSADKYGKVDIPIPIIGTLSFSGDDVEHLRTYMR